MIGLLWRAAVATFGGGNVPQSITAANVRDHQCEEGDRSDDVNEIIHIGAGNSSLFLCDAFTWKKRAQSMHEYAIRLGVRAA
jgi:hypothetical protein